MISPKQSQVCLELDGQLLPICLPKRNLSEKTVYESQQAAAQSILEMCPEVPLGCGNYEVRGGEAKNQEAT